MSQPSYLHPKGVYSLRKLSLLTYYQGGKQCPSLSAAFQQKTLIMKINITSVNSQPDQVSYFATAQKIYKGSGSGVILEILPQSTSDPCFTPFLVDSYVVAASLTEVESCSRVAIVSDDQEDSTAKRRVTCFYVSLNQANYFKLWSQLTPEEKALLGDTPTEP
eukprot:TRINITY_DN1521_c0_g1_i2.p1 TRINITY_DN1521_c0_g1~~TRINITY_DN1521_c0_g1_i2.p1  ORF type:complete len:163 (-),score=22.65 TRINITY_DN1521_c0_g1_i2:56-544(-)